MVHVSTGADELLCELYWQHADAAMRRYVAEPGSSRLRVHCIEAVRKKLADGQYIAQDADQRTLVHARPTTDERGTSIVLADIFIIPEGASCEALVRQQLTALQRWAPPERRRLRVQLFPQQEDVRRSLEQLGFRVDGREIFGRIASVQETLANRTGGGAVPANVRVRALDAGRDLDAVEALEIAAHAAEPTSRVSFETDAARASMRGYYQRIAAAGGAFVLQIDDTVAGTIGLMPDGDIPEACMVSSMSLAPAAQGRAYAWLMLSFALKEMTRRGFLYVNAMSTTGKVLAMAKALGLEPAACSLIGDLSSHGSGKDI